MALNFPKDSIWEKIFSSIIQINSSDLHLSPKYLPLYRHHLQLIPLGDTPLTAEDLNHALVNYFLTPEQYKQLQEQGALDFRCQYAKHNFRGNVFSTYYGYAMALRKIPQSTFPLDTYQAKDTLWQLLQGKRGLILICGATGTGKSSTLASMIETLNQKTKQHIITLEDPIEYVFTSDQSLIQQRELGRDFNSFPQGIKMALRQDPDLLMVGEIRDSTTMQSTLEAAETGHLVLGTLHAGSTIEAISRVISFFSQEEAYSRRQQLAQVLKGIIAQQLILHQEQIHCVMEILLPLSGICNLIRQGKDEQILTQIQLHRQTGMITMAEAIKLIKGT